MDHGKTMKVGLFLKESGIGKSHAKIILIGEHSVVYDQPAIALPIHNIKMTATLASITETDQLIDSKYYHGPLEDGPASLDGVQRLVNYLIKKFHGEQDHWKLTIDSMLPAERGMGSSAATSIAIIRAFFDLHERDLTRTELLALADIEEQITHSNPSGLDAATVSAVNPIWYRHGQTGKELDMNVNAVLVIGDTGIQGRTGEAVTAVRNLIHTNPKIAKPAIERLGQLTVEAQTLLKTGAPLQLGEVLNEAQEQLVNLQVSHPKLDEFIAVARQNGALGAKLTGGGLGGCMIALARDTDSAQKISEALKEAGSIRNWIEPLEES